MSLCPVVIHPYLCSSEIRLCIACFDIDGEELGSGGGVESCGGGIRTSRLVFGKVRMGQRRGKLRLGNASLGTSS